RRRGDTVQCGTRHDPTPGRQAVADGAGEVLVREQERQVRVALVRLGDAVQEAGPDDAATAPDAGHGAAVDVPAELRARRGDLVEALRVGDDLGRVQLEPDVLDEGVTVGDV